VLPGQKFFWPGDKRINLVGDDIKNRENFSTRISFIIL